MGKSKSRLLFLTSILVGSLLLSACLEEEGLDLQVSGVGSNPESAERRASLSALDSNGEPLKLTPSNTSVTIETRKAGGTWSAASQVQLDFGGPARIDTILVADNSGSLHSQLPQMKTALTNFTRLLLNGNGGDRVGLVRVSTESTLSQELTDDRAEVDDAISQLFVTNGWTAFYDGVRVANEALEAGSQVRSAQAPTSYCVDEAHRAIVAFTDGDDNQSADQHQVSSGGDGVDTTLADLFALRVNNVAVPVYTVGVGKNLDASILADIAAQTGGTYRDISSYRQLKGALTSAANQLKRSISVCFEAVACAHDQAKISVEVTHQGQTVTEEFVVDLAAEGCPS